MQGDDPTAALPRSVSSSRVGEVAEVLESETHVDMEKLLSLAHQGVPDELRAEAWKYMLGVSRSERAEEMSLRKSMETLNFCKIPRST